MPEQLSGPDLTLCLSFALLFATVATVALAGIARGFAAKRRDARAEAVRRNRSLIARVRHEADAIEAVREMRDRSVRE